MENLYTYHLKKKNISGRNNWRRVSREKFLEIRENILQYSNTRSVRVSRTGFESPSVDGRIQKML